MPAFYGTEVWKKTSSFIKSDNINYVADAFMIFNIIVVFIETTMDLQDKEAAASVIIFSLIECGFTVVYLWEMVLKIMAYGFNRY